MPKVPNTLEPLTPGTVRAVRLSMNRDWLAQLEEEFAPMETIALDDLDRLIGVLLELGVQKKALVHATCESTGSAKLTSFELLMWFKAESDDDVSREKIDADFSQDTRRDLVRRFLAVAASTLLN